MSNAHHTHCDEGVVVKVTFVKAVCCILVFIYIARTGAYYLDCIINEAAMSVLDINERRAYLESPYFKKHEFADYSNFYITVTVCTVFALVVLLINVVIGCCSRYSGYWNDRHTGNRWLVSLWTATPHNQPSLDYGDIDPEFVPEKIVYDLPRDATEYSDLDFPHSHTQEPLHYEGGRSSGPTAEYLELQQKSRESDI